jgi:thiosulfate/3-mercaptopyruvate sulfurtransferase
MQMSFTVTLLAFMLPAADSPVGYVRPDLLIEPTDLATVSARGLHVLDARGKGNYLDGHVPGAVWVDATTWARTFGEGTDLAAWEKTIGGLGIALDTPVAIYDNQAKDACRVWWILKYWGVKDVRLVNGGWKGYHATGAPADKGEVVPARVAVRLAPRRERLATKSQIKEIVTGEVRGTQIVDSRSSGEYCGTEQTAKRNGSVPGAVHLEWSDTLDAKTGRFKSASELTRLFRESGIDMGKSAVTYCQSGGRASVMAFALELMGAKDVRNYYKSWAEWGNDPDTPVVKPRTR